MLPVDLITVFLTFDCGVIYMLCTEYLPQSSYIPPSLCAHSSNLADIPEMGLDPAFVIRA